MAHAYAAYGLRIRSELAFPEFLPATDSGDGHACDVRIGVGAVAPGHPPGAGVESWVEVRGAADETLCTYAGVGRFLVRGDSSIIVDAQPGADRALVRHALLGPVMAPLLWRRGLFTLHASVIEVEGRCVAFVALSGDGKSTTGAALYARGHTLVSDDLGAIDWREHPVRVLPGFPRLRVFPDSLRGIGDDPASHPRVHASIDKRSKHAERFASGAVVLDRIFVLDQGDGIEAEPLGKAEAMMELLRHSYASSQLAPIVGFAMHMRMAASVAERVPVFRLRRPRNLEKLAELVGFVERQLAA